MNSNKIKLLRQLYDQSTKGVWSLVGDQIASSKDEDTAVARVATENTHGTENAKLIVEAVNSLPMLLAAAAGDTLSLKDLSNLAEKRVQATIEDILLTCIPSFVPLEEEEDAVVRDYFKVIVYKIILDTQEGFKPSHISVHVNPQHSIFSSSVWRDLIKEAINSYHSIRTVRVDWYGLADESDWHQVDLYLTFTGNV